MRYWFLKASTHRYIVQCDFISFQSGEAGATLAFTIIPVHDDNIDLNFEPVS